EAATGDRGGNQAALVLLEAGADPKPTDRRGNGAMAWALRRGEEGLARAVGARAGVPATSTPLEAPHATVDDTPEHVHRALERTLPLLERAGPSFRVAS